MFHLGIKTNVLTHTCISKLSICVCICIWILVQIIPKLRADPINIRLCWWARRSRADLNIYSTLPHTQTCTTPDIGTYYIQYIIYKFCVLAYTYQPTHTLHIIFTKRPDLNIYSTLPHTQTCINPAHAYMYKLYIQYMK